jgi:methylglutaconyl-CoA hydratase
MSDTVLLVDKLDQSTAVLTLNRPQKRNALNLELIGALTQQFAALATDPHCRVAILTGAGPSFCTGLDLGEAAAADATEQSSHAIAALLQTVIDSPLVIIAAAHGAAYAGGAGLMAACDIVLAAEDLQICFPEVRRGLVPALVATVLRHRISGAHLRELCLLGEPISARQAASIGLVHRVVPGDSMLSAAHAVARAIQRGAPDAVRQTKRLLAEHGIDGESLWRLALEYHQQARASHEAREGLSAFLQRRQPHW